MSGKLVGIQNNHPRSGYSSLNCSAAVGPGGKFRTFSVKFNKPFVEISVFGCCGHVGCGEVEGGDAEIETSFVGWIWILR
jgi:hypothetical protein